MKNFNENKGKKNKHKTRKAICFEYIVFMEVINLIAGPRNLSTAIMYSFAQREDCVVLDEPFYGHYLKNSNLEVTHPSEKEILKKMDLNEKSIVDNINKQSTTSNMFVKGMAHHYLGDHFNYILDWNNIILIRHPKKLISSFSKVIKNPSIKDIGIKKASQLFLFLKENNKTPIVIDSDELMLNPEKYLKKLCKLLNIPFSKNMLHWKKGGIPEDGLWASHWYANVHNTTGFAIQKKKETELSKKLQPLLEEALPFYETLKNNILKNN